MKTLVLSFTSLAVILSLTNCAHDRDYDHDHHRHERATTTTTTTEETTLGRPTTFEAQQSTRSY